MNRTSNWKLALDVAKNLGLPVFTCREQDPEFAVNGKICKMPAKAPTQQMAIRPQPKSLDQIDCYGPETLMLWWACQWARLLV